MDSFPTDNLQHCDAGLKYKHKKMKLNPCIKNGSNNNIMPNQCVNYNRYGGANGAENYGNRRKNKKIYSFYDVPPIQGGKRSGIIFVDTTQPTSYFLVVQGRTTDIWSFPKGRMKNEVESEEEAAKREVKEETGIDVDINFISMLPTIKIGKNVYFVYQTEKTKFSSFKINDTLEVKDVKWLSVDHLDILGLNCNKDIRAVLKMRKTKNTGLLHQYSTLIYYGKKIEPVKHVDFNSMHEQIETSQISLVDIHKPNFDSISTTSIIIF